MAIDINLRQVWPEDSVPLSRHSLYRKVDAQVRRLQPGRTLEVGCLSGRYLKLLAGRGWDVKGLELQPQREPFIVQGDAAKAFPFGEEFDLVLAVEVIEHVVDTTAFLEHCADVLKPGGLLVVTTPNLLFWVNRLLMLAGRRPRFAYADYHVRMFVLDDLREKILRGYEIVDLRGSHILAGVRHGTVFRIFEVLGDLIPSMSAHFVITARKRESL